MTPFTLGQDPTVTKRCSHCDTALEFEPVTGGRVVFTAHDDQFCRDATRERVKMLEAVLLSQREAYERAFERQRRWLDSVLKEHGLPSLAERAKIDELKRAMAEQQRIDARALAELNGLGVSPDLLSGGFGGPRPPR